LRLFMFNVFLIIKICDGKLREYVQEIKDKYLYVYPAYTRGKVIQLNTVHQFMCIGICIL
jgi:hypothetical protein